MKLVIEVRGENAGTRMEFDLTEVEELRVMATEEPGREWSMVLGGKNVFIVIRDAKERREA